MNDFQQFLNPGEQIIETIKPHKGRFIIFGILGSIFASLFVSAFGVFMLLTEGTEDSEGQIMNYGFIPYIVIGVAVLALFIGILTSYVSYKKTVYAYTDQRVFFRTGFIGKDFHFLEYKNIQGISVFVNLADKFFHPNTGNIIFMSSAMPMMMMMQNNSNNNINNNGYTFKNISDAYNVYQRINNAYNASKSPKE